MQILGKINIEDINTQVKKEKLTNKALNRYSKTEFGFREFAKEINRINNK